MTTSLPWLPEWSLNALALLGMMAVIAGCYKLGDWLIELLCAEPPPPARPMDVAPPETEEQALRRAIDRAQAGYFVGQVPDAWALERDALLSGHHAEEIARAQAQSKPPVQVRRTNVLPLRSSKAVSIVRAADGSFQIQRPPPPAAP